jgi:glycogen phosphorylase
MQSSHYLPRSLPEPVQALAVLALDLRWSWNHGADDLWRSVDPSLWESTANPWLILESVSDDRLQALARNPDFLARLQAQLDERETHCNSPGWFASDYANRFDGSVAYFSMEFGFSDALPIFAGGLGVLAGDYLKTACDLDVPVVGIGLLYQQGYFRQSIDARGEQIEFYPYSDPMMLPVVPLRDAGGKWVRVVVELPGRDLRLRTWRAAVGRRELLLLDSNDLLNAPGDRGITSELYGGGTEMRLQQEIVLGIGGWRLLEQLGIDCPVCHLNEGHAAFAILERARHFMRRNGSNFRVALRATRAGNLFTTHTPLSSGFDKFSPELFRPYFANYAENIGIGLDELLALGRLQGEGDPAPFNMACLAVRGAGAVNGVSNLHGAVSREIFQRLFPHWPRSEVPVGHVTNGVHMPTWDSAVADELWTQACGKSRWRGELKRLEAGLRKTDDETLWNFRQAGRRKLVAFLAERAAAQQRRHGSESPASARGTAFDPDILTLGFARRFAEYKRMNLLLHDPRRLIRLLSDHNRPIQLVVAGKAHPDDANGKRMVREWQDFLRSVPAAGRAVFIEDYDMKIAGELTQGVDVWLNTPRRPYEASGTSGMKVLVNGGLNLSEIEGWWAEAYAPEVGWALGDGAVHGDDPARDAEEAESLYRLLETEVVPSFYERDERGLPRAWIALMRESMARLTTKFSSNRMLREYTERYYSPLAAAARQRDATTAAGIEQWHARLERNWGNIHFGNVTVSSTGRGHHFEVQIYLYELDAAAISVELYADPVGDGGPERHVLNHHASLSGTANAHSYDGRIRTRRPASDYTPRIVPAHAAAAVPLEAGMILWYR